MRTVTYTTRLRDLADRCAANERAIMEPIERQLAERGIVLSDRLDRDGNNEMGALDEASQSSLERPMSAGHAPGPVQVVRS